MFSISTHFDRQKHLYFKLFSLVSLIQTIQFSINLVFVYTQLNVKTVLLQTIQFTVCTISISKRVLFQTIQFSIQKQFHFKHFSLAQGRSLNVKTNQFQAIQPYISKQICSI